jgi:hypothetical protein
VAGRGIVTMASWREKLRHGFAVPERQSLVVPEETRALIDSVCRDLVARGLADPALILLEMSRPMNYVGAQALHALTPLLGVVARPQTVSRLAEFLEQRGSVEYVGERIEAIRGEIGQRAGHSGTPPASPVSPSPPPPSEPR